MPNGGVAIGIAIAGILFLLFLQLPGWVRLWRCVKGWQRGALFLGGVTVQLPFVYWLLLYKAVPMELPRLVWYGAWVWALVGAFVSIGVGLEGMFRNRRKSASVSGFSSVEQQRRQFIRYAVLSGISLVASTQLLATTQRRRHVEFVELPVVGLAPELEGLTIGVLSDIHSGPFMQRSQIERFRRELEELGCDVIVLPGDFIINRTAEIYPCSEALAGLKAPLGVFAVTGNHDYFGGDVERVCYELEQAGIRFLRNEAVSIGRNGATVTLAGLDDFYARSLPEYVERGRDLDGVLSVWERQVQGMGSPRIVLCHRPYYFEPLVLLGADAVIAGHTHGGQIVVAEIGSLSLSPAGIVSPYVAGTYWSTLVSRRWMYVTRGIGTVGIPIRWNAPPEITHIRLVPAVEEA